MFATLQRRKGGELDIAMHSLKHVGSAFEKMFAVHILLSPCQKDARFINMQHVFPYSPP